MPPADAENTIEGWLQILNGDHVGRTIRLDQGLIRIGHPGESAAMVARRRDGYYLSHLEGEAPTRVNDQDIGEQTQALRHEDILDVGALQVQFFLDTGEQTADSVQQRRFSRVAFDAAASLVHGGESWQSSLVDLSLKGALMVMPEGWTGQIGDQAQLEVRLDEDALIGMEVSVAHMEHGHVGLLCHEIDVDSITVLRRLIELNLADNEVLERELTALG